MAKLSHPADSSHATPVADRTSVAATGSPPAMSSPLLHSLSLEGSLQSHGNDNLPPSPPRRGSGRSSLSPTDYRTLKKILRDVGSASPPPTPSLLEPGEQLFANTDHTGGTVNGSTEKDDDGYHLTGDEAANTGYEDEDDSMELSEGVEGVTTGNAVDRLGNPASPSISYSDRRLQESVSTHDEKDRLRYSGRRPSVAKNPRTKQHDRESDKPVETTQGDTIEDVMNLPGKRAPPARPLGLGRSDSDRQPMPDSIKQLNRMRLSMENVLEDERMEQERAQREEEPGVFIPEFSTPQDNTTDFEVSDIDGFDADNEGTSLHAPEAQRTKSLQGNAPLSEAQTSTVVSEFRKPDDATLLVPNTPTATAQTPGRNHIQLLTNQNVPETPFTKTLSYFKQYKGAENSASKRRRNTALPQEIAEVADIAIDAEDKEILPDQKKSQPAAPDTDDTNASPTESALADLESMVPSQANKESEARDVNGQGDVPPQAPASTDAVTEETHNAGDASELTQDDTQKQLILYPQHPAFVNAIGMIPATMF